MHAIWTLPEENPDFSTRWRLIKGYFSRHLPQIENISPSRKGRGERGIWQRRYWEHTLRDEDDVARHVDYIHINPLKHGHVQRVCDWPHSSFHHFVKQGRLSQDWAGGGDEIESGFGEM